MIGSNKSGRLIRLGLILCLLATGGCATLSEGECRQADWEAIGERDGADGYPAGRIARHREACAEYGILPDAEAYARGRLAGLDQLCTPMGGLRQGRAGRGYEGVCPPGFEQDFYEGYQLGRRIHSTLDQMDDTERAIRDLEMELQRYDLDDDRRNSIYFMLREYERDHDALERQLERLEEEEQRLLRDLQDSKVSQNTDESKALPTKSIAIFR